jgi:hypothetical protein
METKITRVNVENPEFHWEFINVKGKRVLDLGCGDFGNAVNLPYITTAEYFLDNGASYVLGVDLDAGDISRINNHLGSKLELRNENITSPDQIKNLIIENQIQIVKSDIEGGEIHLLEMSDEDFSQIEEYYIETHNTSLESGFVDKLTRCGYIITDMIILSHTNDVCKVFFAKKA